MCVIIYTGSNISANIKTKTGNKRVSGSSWKEVDSGRKEETRLTGHTLSQANANLNDKLCLREWGYANSKQQPEQFNPILADIATCIQLLTR
jgi:hypothetical protein